MTPQQLRDATGCIPERAQLFADHLSTACRLYGIDTPARQAAFIAQLAHESGALRYVREVWGPTPAQARYEGRADLGNTQPGDGRRYCGRGLIQVTGRHNYARARDQLHLLMPDAPDFEAQPEELERPQWAALSAAEYWASHGCNELADAGDFERITRRINGGLNGQADRLARWERTKAVFAAPALGAEPAPTEQTTVIIEPAELPAPPPEHSAMPIPAILAALLPTLVGAVPDLVKLIKPDSESANKNAELASRVFDIAGKAIGAANAQDVVEKITASPAAAQVVGQAVRDNWFDLQEVAGGGIAAARQADLAFAADPVARVWRSPSFLAMLVMTPLVYMIVGSVAGLWGYGGWSDEVRTAIGTTVISLVIGSAAGYYFGSTTSKNKPAQT